MWLSLLLLLLLFLFFVVVGGDGVLIALDVLAAIVCFRCSC